MMKKKIKDQEATKENLIDKSTENKENTAGNNINNDKNGSESLLTETKEPENVRYDSGIAADKMVLEVKASEEKLAEMQDKYLRLSAEFDNYRRRTLREKMDLSKYAGENLLLGIIPIIDDFERALAHIDSSADSMAVKDGIGLIYGKFTDFLKQNGVKEIESLNCNFDVDVHEAVAKVPVEEADKKGKVVDVVQKGYFLQDKVLRFSKVVVGE
jgi:molecular chaperone GrpE